MGLERKAPASWRGSRDGGGSGGNVDILLSLFYSLTHFLFFFPSYQKKFSSLEGEHL